MLPDGVECFAGDLSEEEKKVVWATHFVPAADLFTQKLDVLPGSRSPVRTSWPRPHCPPDLYGRATTTEVASSHIPMLSSLEFD